MPGRGWHKPDPVDQQRISVPVTNDLADEIRKAMKEDGESYAAPYVRKLIRHGLALRNMKVGQS